MNIAIWILIILVVLIILILLISPFSMAITNIEQDGNIFKVTFSPTWFQKLLGIKEKTEEYKDTWATFMFGDGHVYMKKDGSKLSNGNWIGTAIDKHRRKW